MVDLLIKPNWAPSSRLKLEKVGTSWTKASDQFDSTHGQHKFEGTMPGDVGITESREQWCVFFSSPLCFECKVAGIERYQLEIVEADGLRHLLHLCSRPTLRMSISSVACMCNVSNHFPNDTPIIESGFLQPLINILSFKDNEEAQLHRDAISTLRNLAANSKRSKIAIVKARMVHSIKKLVSDVSMDVQSAMTACVAVLALNDDLK